MLVGTKKFFNPMINSISKFFKLEEMKTSFKTEILAGITIFTTMCYIIAVNPAMLEQAGMDKGAAFVATIISSVIATMCMALLANKPFALAPGMGLNAYFVFKVCLGNGCGWKVALTAVFLEGIIFMILSITKAREKIFDAIPMNLKIAVAVGIGLFIMFIGLINSKIIVADPSTLVALNSFDADSFNYQGITAVLAIIGIIITGILVSNKKNYAIIAGIFITWFLGIFCELMGWYVPNVEAGAYSMIPNFTNWQLIPSIEPSFWKFDFSYIFENTLNFLTIMISFLFVDCFDTIGTLSAGAVEGKMLDKDGKFPGASKALFSDALGTTTGAVCGTPTVTTYVESVTGISIGGRTGLTAFVVAILFLASLIFSPIVLAIPSFATTPALVIVGIMMFKQILNIKVFKDENKKEIDWTELIPVVICVAIMPFAYSIADGIGWGMISYLAMKIATKQWKKINPCMICIALCFILYYIFV